MPIIYLYYAYIILVPCLYYTYTIPMRYQPYTYIILRLNFYYTYTIPILYLCYTQTIPRLYLDYGRFRLHENGDFGFAPGDLLFHLGGNLVIASHINRVMAFLPRRLLISHRRFFRVVPTPHLPTKTIHNC